MQVCALSALGIERAGAKGCVQCRRDGSDDVLRGEVKPSLSEHVELPDLEGTAPGLRVSDQLRHRLGHVDTEDRCSG